MPEVRSKLEAIVHARLAGEPLWGFELLGVGAAAEPFRALDDACPTPVDKRALRLALLHAHLETVLRFRAAARRLPGWDGLRFALNLDAPLLVDSDADLRAALRAHTDLARSCVVFEVHEEATPDLVDALLDLRAAFDLTFVLDDSSYLHPVVRARLGAGDGRPRAFAATKVDAGAAIALIGHAGTAKAAVLAELARHVVEGCPLVVEGVAGARERDFLDLQWTRPESLLFQGYAVHPPAPWRALLTPLGPTHPNGYTLAGA